MPNVQKEIKKAVVFQPSSAMQNNASRALALLQKYNRGTEDRKQLIQIAKGIVQGNLLISDLKQILSAAVDVSKSNTISRVHADGGPVDVEINKMLLGGDAGLAFSRLQLKKSGIKILGEASETVSNTESKIGSDLNVIKSRDQELKQALFLVLAPEEIDQHGDIYSEPEIRKACHNFNTHCMKANLFHLSETNGASIVESYICTHDISLDGTFIQKGSWLQNWQFHSDELWELVKSGDINGVSIGCMANYILLDEPEVQ